MSFKSNIVKIPFLGRVFLITYRFKNAFPYVAKPLSTMIKWLFTSKETTNFTYDLTHRNKKYLASTISVVTKTPISLIEKYINELNNDDDLKKHIISGILNSDEKHKADLKIRKVKIVNSLLEKGYEVLTYDKDGVPFYMKKGSIKKTIFEFNKQEKDAKA